MTLAATWRQLRRLPHFARRLKDAFFYTVNDGAYWDEYVRARERDATPGPVGSEWTGEHGFLALLRKHAAPGMEALEVGCGGGRITAQAAPLVARLHAADVSAAMLRKCRETVQAGNVRFHRLDGFTLKQFADASLDLVFAHDVFVHLPEPQVYTYLREMGRVLRPGGLGLVSLFDIGGQFGLFRHMSVGLWERRRIPPHMRFYFVNEEMVRALLADLDLEVVELMKEHYLLVVFRRRAQGREQ